jgi:hypothetical protein
VIPGSNAGKTSSQSQPKEIFSLQTESG